MSAQLAHQVLGQGPTAVRQAPHRRCGFNRPIEFSQLHPQRRHRGERRDAVLRASLRDVARGEVVERHHAAPGVPGRKQLVLPIVERQRQDCQRDVIARHPKVVRDADRAEPHVGMAEHHTLWPPGRSAGVEDGRQLFRIATRWRQGFGIARSIERIVFGQRSAIIRQVAGFERGEARGRRDEQPGTAVSHDMRHLGALEQRVDRHMDEARPRCGEWQQTGQFALGRPAGDAGTILGHLRLQPTGERGDTGS